MLNCRQHDKVNSENQHDKSKINNRQSKNQQSLSFHSLKTNLQSPHPLDFSGYLPWFHARVSSAPVPLCQSTSAGLYLEL